MACPLPYFLFSRQFVPAVIPHIDAAHNSIDVIMFDWRLYPGATEHPVMQLTDALARAASRRVCVRVLGSNALTRARLEQLGIKCRGLYAEKMVHAKVMVIDDEVVIIGSHNYTASAMFRNLEISIIANLGDAATEWRRYFDGLWGV
jgi:phosphatidylserine/phosphatidylglycerophosphate/cardiolipin synthase-like enzyme